MNKIRCTVCGSDDVEVKAFVKPNLDGYCSITDFTDYLDNPDNCFCIECGTHTRMKYFSDDTDVFGEQNLYDLMTGKLRSLYSLASFDQESVYGLAHEEYLRVRKEVCLEYGFDEEEYIQENGGETPFDEYDEDIRQEVYARVVGFKEFAE